MTDIVRTECCEGCEKYSYECDECATNYYMTKLEARIRKDERLKLLNWLSRKHGINTCVGLINGNLGYKELDVEEVLQDYEENLKGSTENKR